MKPGLFRFIFIIFAFIGTMCGVTSGLKDCLSDADCDEGDVCQNAKCIPISEADLGPDVGPDLGPDVGPAEDVSVDTNQCSEGQSECTGTTAYHQCTQSDGAWVWGAEIACGEHQRCEGAACLCNDECSLGDFRCAGTEIVGPDYEKCLADPDQCLIYELLPCASGFTCPSNINMCASGEFMVNSFTTSLQWFGRVAKLDDHRFAVVWPSLNQEAMVNQGIYGKIMDSQGNALTSEFHVNTYTLFQQNYPSIGAFSGGNFVVIWQSQNQDQAGTGLFGRVFDSQGKPLTSEFPINQTTVNDQTFSRLEVLSNNNFAVVWQNDLGSYSEMDFYSLSGRVFDPLGHPVIDEFTLDVSNQKITAHMKSSEDRFLIVWNFNLTYTVGVTHLRLDFIKGQFRNNQGFQLADNFQISEYTSTSQSFPQIEKLDNTRFAVVWNSNQQDGDKMGVFGRIVDNNSGNISPVFQVNSYTAQNQQLPFFDLGSGILFSYYRQIQKVGEDRFVVVWQSENIEDVSGFTGMFGKVFDYNGTPISSEFPINSVSTTIFQAWPQLVALDSQRFMVVWQNIPIIGSPDNGEIFGAIFDKGGQKTDSDFMINITTSSNQIYPFIDRISNNRFLVIWNSGLLSSLSLDIMGRIFYFE